MVNKKFKITMFLTVLHQKKKKKKVYHRHSLGKYTKIINITSSCDNMRLICVPAITACLSSCTMKTPKICEDPRSSYTLNKLEETKSKPSEGTSTEDQKGGGRKWVSLIQAEEALMYTTGFLTNYPEYYSIQWFFNL